MSYIIIAEIFTSNEENASGNILKVDAQILSRNDNSITFNIKGNFFNQKELTRKMCHTLIDAGFISFTIRHSY